MTEDQRIVGGLVMAALTADHEGLARLVNDLPADKIRPAAAHALGLMANTFRSVIAPNDWQYLVNEARSALLELQLDN